MDMSAKKTVIKILAVLFSFSCYGPSLGSEKKELYERWLPDWISLDYYSDKIRSITFPKWPKEHITVYTMDLEGWVSRYKKLQKIGYFSFFKKLPAKWIILPYKRAFKSFIESKDGDFLYDVVIVKDAFPIFDLSEPKLRKRGYWGYMGVDDNLIRSSKDLKNKLVGTIHMGSEFHATQAKKFGFKLMTTSQNEQLVLMLMSGRIDAIGADLGGTLAVLQKLIRNGTLGKSDYDRLQKIPYEMDPIDAPFADPGYTGWSCNFFRKGNIFNDPNYRYHAILLNCAIDKHVLRWLFSIFGKELPHSRMLLSLHECFNYALSQIEAKTSGN